MKALNFISQPIENKLRRTFKLNGYKYRILSDVYKLNGGQYITLQHLLRDPEKVVDNMHQIMAVFVIPYERKWYGWKRGEYDPNNHEWISKEMLNCSIDIIHPLSAFFLDSWKKFVERTLASSVKEVKKAEKTMIRELKRIKPNTAGWLPSIPSVITMLRNGIFSSSLNSGNSSISSLFKRPSKPTSTN